MIIFSKMATTIFIKLWRFIVHSSPNNMTLLAFPGKKVLITRKIFFNFLSAPNVAPKPTDHRSNSISRAPLQISLARSFRFRSTLKLRIVHIRKKKFHFLKNVSNDFHQILWIYCTFEPPQYGTIGFSQEKSS